MIPLAKRPKRRTLAQAREDAERAIRGEVVVAKSTKRDGAKRARPRHIEDDEQKALFAWAALAQAARPELRLLFAIPNGGKRDVREAARMKAQGVKAGVPDVCLPVQINTYDGGFGALFIELKRPIVKGERKPELSDDQKQWLTDLTEAGACCCVAYGWEEARESIEAYLAVLPVPHQWVAP